MSARRLSVLNRRTATSCRSGSARPVADMEDTLGKFTSGRFELQPVLMVPTPLERACVLTGDGSKAGRRGYLLPGAVWHLRRRRTLQAV
jgi:hypothetical protein